MTNDEFLNALFWNRPGGSKIFTCSFPQPPDQGDYRFNPFLPDQNNNFFCVSALTSVERRIPQNFASLHVLVVDDVGTKVSVQGVAETLGMPTYSIETSSGNFQLGFVFTEPVTDRAVAEGMVQALCRAFTDDVAGVNRLVRLPVGRNTKPGKDFLTRLVFYNREVLHTPESLIEKLGAVPVEAVDEDRKPFLPADQDPVLRAFERMGMRYQNTREPGVYKITCPWVDEHTGGRDDGTVYIAPAGYKCHHGHCANKTFADLRRELELSADDVDDAIVRAALGVGTGGVQETPTTEASLTSDAPPVRHPWLDQTVRDLFNPDGTILTKAQRNQKFPRTWLFDGLIPMGTPWALAGEGGLGKSRLAMALCMSVASGVPLGENFIPDPNPHPVLFLTQEDDQNDRAHRFCTQYERLADRDRRWRSDIVAHRLIDNLYIPTLKFGQQLTKRFFDDVEDFARQRGGPRLVLFDPLVLFWDHSDERRSINSAAGVIATFIKLIDIARVNSEGASWSAGILHHMNKTGEQIYGSVMIANHVRTLFQMTPTEIPPDDDFKYATLEVVKSNSTNKKGTKYVFELDKETAAVYPRDSFAHEDPEQKLAAIVRENKDGITTTDLKARGLKLGLTNVAAILGQWRGQPEKMTKLGIRLGKYNRFEPDGGLGGDGD